VSLWLTPFEPLGVCEDDEVPDEAPPVELDPLEDFFA
jgi:hypothetical protein